MPRNIALVVFLSLSAPVALRAHEEPPKTLAERMEYERHRKQIMAAGIRTETVWKTPAGGERRRQLWTLYDRNGNPIEQHSFAGDSVTVRVLSRFSEENLLFEQIVIAGRDTERTAFAYLAPRIVASAVDYAPSGTVRARLVYSYSDTLITAVKTDSLDAPVYTLAYRYAPGTGQRLLMEAVQTDAGGNRMTLVRNVYDGDRRTEKRVFRSADTLEYSFHYTTTPAGDPLTITRRLPGGATVFQRRYAYAAEGIVDSIMEYDGDGVLRSTLTYTYERFGTGN